MDITVRAISGAILLERRFPHTVFGQEVLVLALQQLSADGPGVAKLFHGTTCIDTCARLGRIIRVPSDHVGGYLSVVPRRTGE